jgi:hypothetical protein
MRQEIEPTPESLKKFNKHEEALEGFKEDLEHGLSESDKEFEQEKEETAEELGVEIIKENKDKKSKQETIH